MSIHPELLKISQITENIFISGIFPLNENSEMLKQLKIKHILSCVPRDHISQIHDKIMMGNPNMTILCLPYNDEIQQNLWEKNKNQISMSKYTSTINDHKKVIEQLNIYNNKSLIEIGYHFINNALCRKENILIHCMAGVSRSVSIVTYFLMKKYYLTFNDSYHFIKNKRSIARPNDSFKMQLEKYYIKKDKFTEIDAARVIFNINTK